MRAIILAQGRQQRLEGLGQRKQTLQVAGEPIIHRTARLLWEFGVGHVAMAGWKPIWSSMPSGTLCYELEDPGLCILDGMADTRKHWWARDDYLLFVLGDVVFSRKALLDIVDRTLLNDTFFAATPDLARGDGEVFAMGVHGAELDEMLATVECRQEHSEIKNEPYAKYQCGHLRHLVWKLMDVRGLPCDSHPAEYHSSIALPINDWTTDIDTFNDVAQLDSLGLRVLADRRARTKQFCGELR